MQLLCQITVGVLLFVLLVDWLANSTSAKDEGDRLFLSLLAIAGVLALAAILYGAGTFSAISLILGGK